MRKFYDGERVRVIRSGEYWGAEGVVQRWWKMSTGDRKPYGVMVDDDTDATWFAPRELELVRPPLDPAVADLVNDYRSQS